MSVVLLNAHSSQRNLWLHWSILPSNLDLFLSEIGQAVVELSTQLNILVQISEMRRPHIVQLQHFVLLF